MNRLQVTAKKYSVVRRRVSASRPTLPTGLNQPVASPAYDTNELAAFENMITFAIRRSFEGAMQIKPSDASMHAVVISTSCEKRLPYFFLDKRRCLAKSLRVRWYMRLKVVPAMPSWKTGMLFLRAFMRSKRFESRLNAKRNNKQYLSTLPALCPRIL